MHTKPGRVEAELEERVRVHVPVLLPANLQLEQVGENVLRGKGEDFYKLRAKTVK